MQSITIEGIEHRKIPGYENYFISIAGRIFSEKTFGKFSKKKRNSFIHTRLIDGFAAVSLYRNGKAVTERVHRLLAITFLPPEHKKKYVVFKNGIKSDIRIENIEWSYSKREGSYGEEKNTI